MREGKIIGDCERLVTWYKPKRCPTGLTHEQFVTLPATLTVREVYYYIIIPGFRTQQVSLITTLLDSKTYPALELVRLYGKRWHVELNLKHLKTTLGMDILRGKSPQMIRKEIYVFLLAYNLLRSLMWSSGTTCGIPPLRLSIHRNSPSFSSFYDCVISC